MRILRARFISYISAAFFFGALLITVSAPYVASAQGLVSCGLGTGIQAFSCQFCSLFQLADNIIKFLLLIAAPIAALLFAYAGFLYMSSGGAQENVSKAKNIFTDVLIGFIIALCGWLVVDTIIRS